MSAEQTLEDVSVEELAGRIVGTLAAYGVDGVGHIVTELALRARRAETADALADAALAAREHTDELEDAWARGHISEHDGQGGTRSNRNVDVNRALRRALDAYTEARREAREGE